MTSTIAPTADQQLKAKHRALWASGDYPSVAAELIPTLGPTLVEACAVRAGQRVLDVGAGSGNAAIPAAATGADVTASDLTPELFIAGRRIAARRGVDLAWVEGDAEALPFADGEFDAVLCECSLCLFTDKRRAVAEIRRVLRPGGRFALSDVVVDRERLPFQVDGALATVACVGEALSRRGNEQLLAEAGLRLTAIEERDDDAAALAMRVEDRLRGARILGLDRLEGSPISTAEAIELVRSARQAISKGSLGYAIFAGFSP
jgi:SAM-dependent methyltransferase